MTFGKVAILLCSFLLFLVLPVQSAPGKLNGRVVGGEDAVKNQFPHQVSLRQVKKHFYYGPI